LLHPTSNRLERILICGEADAGKSSAWVSIAHWIVKTKSQAKVRVLDTDGAWDAMWSSEIESAVEVVSTDRSECDTWPGIMQGFKKKADPNDWIVVDMIDEPYEAAKGVFWQAKERSSLAEVYLRNVTGEGFDMGGGYGRNWDAINKVYDEMVGPFFSAPCHKLACTPAQEVWTDRQGLAANKTDQQYVQFKFKPRGATRLAHKFHTILLAQKVPSGRGAEWLMTTMKERGPIGLPSREMLLGESVQAGMGFVGAYLMKVAGWRL